MDYRLCCEGQTHTHTQNPKLCTLRFSSGTRGLLHWHWILTLKVNCVLQNITQVQRVVFGNSLGFNNNKNIYIWQKKGRNKHYESHLGLSVIVLCRRCSNISAAFILTAQNSAQELWDGTNFTWKELYLNVGHTAWGASVHRPHVIIHSGVGRVLFHMQGGETRGGPPPPGEVRSIRVSSSEKSMRWSPRT